MESTTVQVITTALAVLGAVLGLYNAWRNWIQDRVRLKVSVSYSTFHSGVEPGEPGFSIAIVNLSNFPLTITTVGMDRLGGKLHMQIAVPFFMHGEKLPIRLAPRTAATAFLGLSTLQPEQLLAIRRAYVHTACGKRAVSKGALFNEYRSALAEKG